MSVSTRQKLAASYIAVGLTNFQVSKLIGVSERQLYRWQEQSAFMEEVAVIEAHLKEKVAQGIKQSGDAVASAIARSSRLLDRAVDVLENALESDDVRLRDKLETIKILATWNGLNSDFNTAMATLTRYGLELYQSKDGDWRLKDLNAEGREKVPKGCQKEQ